MLPVMLLLIAQPVITETDTMYTEVGDGYEICLCYPEVLGEHETLDGIIREYTRGWVDEFRGDYLDYFADDPFMPDWYLEINITPEPSPRGMISLIAWVHTYMGGAHGNMTTQAFNYSVADGELIGIVDLLGGEAEFEAFAAETRKILKERENADGSWVDRGAAADPRLYHTVVPVPGDDCGIKGYTVIFPPYQVECYAAGPIEVFVPED